MRFILFQILLFVFAAAAPAAFGQQASSSPVRSQEISDVYGIPVIIKHLPDWKSVQAQATFATGTEDLKRALGERQVFDLIEFTGGTEAVTAPYPEGKLLIVEYMTPQMAAAADARFLERLAAVPGEPPVVYRRVGNYGVFVFDAPDQEAAGGLLEQVKYEKSVQWLGKDPYIYQKFERYFAVTSRDVALATVMWILGGLFLAIGFGVLCGYLFYIYREKLRANRTAYSDAGGLTRLNLDGLSEPAEGK